VTLFEGDDKCCSRAVAYQQFLELKKMFKDTIGPVLQPICAVEMLWKEHEAFLDGAEYVDACIAFFGHHLETNTDDVTLPLPACTKYREITKSLMKMTFEVAYTNGDIWLDYTTTTAPYVQQQHDVIPPPPLPQNPGAIGRSTEEDLLQ